MIISSLVFSLTYGVADDAYGITIVIPRIEIFLSKEIAAKNKEGIEIVEGDLWFFSSDGSPLAAEFSKKPYINSEKNTYFAGIYTLKAGSGNDLQMAISQRIAGNQSPDSWIDVYLEATDESAQRKGWPNLGAMREMAEQALKIFPPDLFKRIKFEHFKSEKE